MDPLRDTPPPLPARPPDPYREQQPYPAEPEARDPLGLGTIDAPTSAYEPFREPEPREPDPAPEVESSRKPTVTVRRLRRGRLVIRKVNPWAVLRFSLVFHFCMMLISLLGTAVIFATLKAFGVIANLEQVLTEMQFDISIAGGTIFRWFFLIGIVGVFVMSAVTVFMAFLYNLIADVVGGIEITVTERE